MKDIAFCPNCREPYHVYNMICKDQSLCSKCLKEIKDRIKNNDKEVCKPHKWTLSLSYN